MEPAPGRRGRRLPLLLLLGALALALAGGATAWPHPHGGGAGLGVGGAGRTMAAGGERWYRDLALRRMESVRSSFGARRDLATVCLSCRMLFLSFSFRFFVLRSRLSAVGCGS
jgi:hypothetical protein